LVTTSWKQSKRRNRSYDPAMVSNFGGTLLPPQQGEEMKTGQNFSGKNTSFQHCETGISGARLKVHNSRMLGSAFEPFTPRLLVSEAETKRSRELGSGTGLIKATYYCYRIGQPPGYRQPPGTCSQAPPSSTVGVADPKAWFRSKVNAPAQEFRCPPTRQIHSYPT
jgi:hypothetical protein